MEAAGKAEWNPGRSTVANAANTHGHAVKDTPFVGLNLFALIAESDAPANPPAIPQSALLSSPPVHSIGLLVPHSLSHPLH